MLIELLYTSAATRDMTQAALLDLLDTSRRNNERDAITGMLVYHRRSFMQLLEGEEAAVMRLYQTILDDPRHTASRVIWKGPIERRSFGDWTMAFQRLADLDPLLLEGYSTFLEEGFAGEATGERLSMAQTLMRTLSERL